MLGEAAQTEADARRYHLVYSDSITSLAGVRRDAGIRDRAGVSVKLSALHARHEFGQRDRVMTELVARLRSLALLAQSAGIGLNVDAEIAAVSGATLERASQRRRWFSAGSCRDDSLWSDGLRGADHRCRQGPFMILAGHECESPRTRRAIPDPVANLSLINSRGKAPLIG